MASVRFPPDIQQHLLLKTLSVCDFVMLDLPPSTPAVMTRLAQMPKYASKLEPTVHNVNEIVSILSPSDNILETLQQSIHFGLVKSILSPHSPISGGRRYPLWLVSFWAELSSIRKIQQKWRTAIASLETQIDRNKESGPLRQAFFTLSQIQWTGRLQGFRKGIDLHQLSVYFTREWLTNDHELVMLDALKDDLVIAGKPDESFIENTAFILLLGNAFKDKQGYMDGSCYEWLHQQGDDLAIRDTGKRLLSTIANQDGVHWVAIILDFGRQRLYHGNPYGNCISEEHHAIIDWWTEHHANV
ncbi:hypothetical protein H0H81_001272 [Sphagnurus paluster]|uniref:Ubiquitin-like protease family profile domain-containing protein n=1 Tax=Sphagnurus paluster TaxID=117069 RepID=A0A9P7GH91_9AGAR|nr:hypothetical protein H0H81_001272 [Sphagnurus paluster]